MKQMTKKISLRRAHRLQSDDEKKTSKVRVRAGHAVRNVNTCITDHREEKTLSHKR